MSKPILVGHDPRRVDRAPVALGAELARRCGASLLVASVEKGGPAARTDGDLVDDCSAALEQVEADLRTSQVRADCVRLRSTSAARALQELAEQEDAGMLVVGSARTSGVGRETPRRSRKSRAASPAIGSTNPAHHARKNRHRRQKQSVSRVA